MSSIPVLRILPGTPVAPGLRMPNGRYAYPASVLTFIASLKSRGVAAEMSHPEEQVEFVQEKGAEIWAPLIKLTYDILVAVDGGLWTSVLLDILPKKRADDAQLRVHWVILDKDSNEQVLDISGPPEAVLETVKEAMARAIEGTPET